MTDTPQEQPRKEISAEELINIWRGDYKTAIGYDSIYQNDPNGVERVRIKNCIVRGHITIDFLKNLPILHIEDSEIESFVIKNNSLVNGLFFHNHTTVGSISILDNSNVNWISIMYSSSLQNIYVKENAECNGISITDLSIVSNIKIDSPCKMREVRLQRESQAERLETTNATIGSIFVESKSQVKWIHLKRTCKICFLTFSHDAICNNVYIENDTIVGTISAFKSLIEVLYLINKCIINKIELTKLKDGSKLLDISGCRIGELILDINIPYKIVVNEYYSKTEKTSDLSEIQELNLDGIVLHKDSFIHIAQTNINNLYFNSFVNHGTVIFNNISPINEFERFKTDKWGYAFLNEDWQFEFDAIKDIKEASLIEVVNSDLGNTQFIGCDLAEFVDFEFENSKILNVFFADTTLPIRHDINADGKDEHEQRRLALSQFKKIYENQGDAVRATQYRAEEMEVYREQLKSDDSKFFSKDWWNNKGERLNLWLNKKSTYYGNNWLRGVIVTIATTAVLYTAYCSSRSIYPANPFIWDNIKSFWHILPYYFEFLNPIHKTDFFEHIKKDTEPNPGALLIDYLSRIVIAYLVYQTVQAFRKFGKKSA